MNIPTIAALLLAASWPQFGGNAAHTGSTSVSAQPLQTLLASVVMDPFIETELAYYGEDLLVHYATPIVDGNDVFVEVKGGTFTDGDWSTQTWGVQALRWRGNALVPRWTVTSDWKPEPFTEQAGPRFEPLFQPALANGFLCMPGAGGSVLRVNRDTGEIVDRVGATPPLDAATFVSGPLVVDGAGTLFYNVIAMARIGNPWTTDIRDAWLTSVSPMLVTRIVHYANFVKGAPSASDPCLGAFPDNALPWPPSPTALPPMGICGSQRPGVNVAPAIGSDGTVYTVSRAHYNSRWSYLVALKADLSPKWTESLRDRLNDGCNVLLPPNGGSGGCRSGALTGVDPADNTPGAGRVTDDSSSSPLVAPDGSVFYGAYTRYNYEQGHLMHFSAAGSYLGSYPFGWDITPAIYKSSKSYTLISKDNRYNVGSYCDSCPGDRRPNDAKGFFIVALDPSLNLVWSSKAPTGHEWCINGPAIDGNGVSYVNNEDGSLYALNPDGSLRESIRLTDALGQAYTPVIVDDQGRVYAEKRGRLFVAGRLSRQRAVSH